MPALLIKDLPADVHARLKREAEAHRRSMTQQAIVILERGLHNVRAIPPFRAYRGSFPLTNELINAAKREGRA